jgi:urease accessory protein
LSRRAVANGGIAAASVLKFPGSDQDVAAVRALQHCFTGEVGVSAWNGLALVRLVAADGAALRHDLIVVLTALNTGPLPRLWVN